MDQLRRLDESTTKKGMACSLTLGITGVLILGIGMCCTFLWGKYLMIPGIIIGSIGITVIALAYPLSCSITKKEQERLAPEILKLTTELMNGQAYGTGSFQFAVSAILAVVVCHDAMGVRQETGKQAVVINEIVKTYSILAEKNYQMSS